MSIYVLIAILRKQLRLPHSLYTILQILSVSLFEKTPIVQALSLSPLQSCASDEHNQLCLRGI